MAKPLKSLYFLRKLAQSKGGKCLSNEYSICNERLLWECAKGHTWDATYYNIQRGRWCYICSDKKNRRLKKSIEDCHKLAELKGGKCLSSEYIQSPCELIWQCGEGHIWDAPYSRIQRGGWCRKCAGTQKKSIENCHKLAEFKGGKCLSTEYINSYSKLTWQCSKGHIWDATYDSINQGNWCSECAGTKKKSIEDCHKLAELKGGQCLSTEYINSKSILKWQCTKGHVWNSNYNNIKRGYWCSKCNLNNKIEEYNHDQEQQDKKTNNDKKKIMIQKKNKITLQSCQELAESMGGKFLSPEYSVSGAKYKWQCSQGHIFERQYSLVKKSFWCRQCTLKKRKSIEKCHKIAESKGGKCKSTEFENNYSKLTWECEYGHTFSMSYDAINGKNKWCLKCENIERKNLITRTYEKTETNEKQEKPYIVFKVMNEWQQISKNEDSVQRLLDYIIERKSEVNPKGSKINWGKYLALQEIESWIMFNFKFDDKAETPIVQDDEKVMFDKLIKKSGRNPHESNIKLSQISKKAREMRMENEPWKDALKRARAIIYGNKETEPKKYSVQNDEKERFGDIMETQPEQIDIVEHIYVSQKTTDELKEINNQNIIQKVQNRLNELFKYKKID